MSKVFGWWEFDSNSSALINRITQQKVTFAGPTFPERDGAARALARDALPALQFIYEDREVHRPLVVRVPRVARGLREYWLLDYPESLDLWRRELAGEPELPYGLWRRIDECVVDALQCWPNLGLSGPKVEQITVAGGWLNGEWTDSLRREFLMQVWPQNADPCVSALPLETIEAAPPPLWRFTDSPAVNGQASLAGVERLPSKRLYLDPRMRLTGFETGMPSLRRADGEAVMFPAELSSYFHHNTEYLPQALINYADEDVLIRLSCENGYPDSWRFSLHTPVQNWVGLRDRARLDDRAPLGLASDLLAVEESFGAPVARMSYALWRKVSQALIDGWLNWTGTPRYVPEEPAWLARQAAKPCGRNLPEQTGMNLAARSAVDIDGGFVGGVRAAGYKQRAHRSVAAA